MNVPEPLNLLFGDDAFVWVTRFTEHARPQVIELCNRVASATGKDSHTLDTPNGVVAHVPLRMTEANTVPQITLAFGVCFAVHTEATLAAMAEIGGGTERKLLVGRERHHIEPISLSLSLLSVGLPIWKAIWIDSGILPGVMEMVFRGPGGDTFLAPPPPPPPVPEDTGILATLSKIVDEHPLLVFSAAAGLAVLIVRKV